MLGNNSNKEYTLKDVEEMIAALDELPFVEKMGFLALATILMVFSEDPTKRHREWEGHIFTDEAPEHERVHIDDGVIREALRRVDSEIIKRCALGPPLRPLEQYKKRRSRNARSKPDRRAGKPVRKKQLRRAAELQNRKRKETHVHIRALQGYIPAD